MKYKYIFLLLIFLAGKMNAQTDTSSLKEKIKVSELVFEGCVIADSTFWNFNATKIYNLKYVLVSKQFKGNFVSDTVKIIIQESGSRVGGIIQEIEDGGQFHLYKNIEGIFFCKPVDTHIYYGIEVGNSIYQTNLRYGCDGFIQITCASKVPAHSHRAFNCDGTFFDDVEKQLYQPIEKITGEKYKQLRLNCLEQNKQGK